MVAGHNHDKGAHMEYERIVTHTDFDGVVSALLLQDAYGVTNVFFIEPWEIQQGRFTARKGDIICDLPYATGCSRWFDHHSSTAVDAEKGVHEETPSCARLIFERLLPTHPTLEQRRAIVDAADKIDTASFTKEDLEHPDVYGKLSMAIKGDDKRKDDEFRRFLLNMLAFQTPEQVIEQPIVKRRVEEKLAQHERWRNEIPQYVELRGTIIFVDRTKAPADLPRGQPFWLYLTYPGHAAYMVVDTMKYEKDKVKVSVGENIFEKLNTVDIGALMQRYGGGGHKAAGGCSIPLKDKERIVEEIISALNEEGTAEEV